LPPAIIAQSDVTVEAAACSSSHAVVRGVGGVGTHTAQHWVQLQVTAAACGWQSTSKLRLNRRADHG